MVKPLFVKAFKIHESETVEIEWQYADGTLLVQRYTAPPQAVKEARQQDWRREVYNYEAADLAEQHGCKPFWSSGMKAYCCGCADLQHASDQQCSVITKESALHGPSNSK